MKAYKGPYNVSVETQTPQGVDVNGRDVWENHAWAVRLTSTEGHEICMWTAQYIIKGEPRGDVGVEDVRFSQTALTFGKYSPDEKLLMHDSDFIIGGTHLPEYLGPSDLQVVKQKDKVIWKMGDREFVCSPPQWHLRGEQTGVKLDLRAQAISPSFSPSFWRHELRPDNFAYWAPVAYEGIIEVNGTVLSVSGAGHHERAVRIGPDPFITTGRGNRQFMGFDEEANIHFHLMARPNGDGFGWAIVDGEVMECLEDQGQIQVLDTEFWVDPRTWFNMPRRWNVVMQGSMGKLNLTAIAYARACHVWDYLRNRYHILYWNTADAIGTFTYNDGRVVAIRDMKCFCHINRTFLHTNRGPGLIQVQQPSG